MATSQWIICELNIVKMYTCTVLNANHRIKNVTANNRSVMMSIKVCIEILISGVRGGVLYI